MKRKKVNTKWKYKSRDARKCRVFSLRLFSKKKKMKGEKKKKKKEWRQKLL